MQKSLIGGWFSVVILGMIQLRVDILIEARNVGAEPGFLQGIKQ